MEWLTNEVERRANDYIRTIDEMGGMIPAIERGFPQTEIANASYEYQHAVETGDAKIVGVNAFTEQNEKALEILQIDESSGARQVEKLRALKKRRDGAAVAAVAGWPAEGGPGKRKYDAAHSECRACLCDGGRDLRCISR